MGILDRYIGRAVLGGTLLSLLVLLALVVFISFLDELGDLSEHYNFFQISQYILLTIPRRIHELIPTSALLGCLIGMGALANQQELIAMQAAGVSKSRIIFSVLKAGGIIIFVAILLGEWIAPKLETEAQALKARAKTNKVALGTEYGFWARDGLTFINIRNVLTGSKLRDVYIYEVNENHELRVSTHAETAYFEGDSWILEGIKQSYIKPNGVRALTLEKAQWESLLDPGLMSFVVVEPESLSVTGLYGYANYLENNGQDAHRYKVAMWSKLTSPIDIALMLMLAVPFVLGSMRNVSIGNRILIGTLIGVSYYIIDKAFDKMGTLYTLPPLVVFVPVVIYTGLFYFFRRKLL